MTLDVRIDESVMAGILADTIRPVTIPTTTAIVTTINLGDSLWWQGKIAYFTRRSMGESKEFKLERIGLSGVNHPMGKEFMLEGSKRIKINNDI